MYQNLECRNLGPKEYDVEIEGEVMLMETADYFPEAVSAIAKLTKEHNDYVCEFEVCSQSDIYTAEASAEDPCLCLQIVEQRMRDNVAHHIHH